MKLSEIIALGEQATARPWTLPKTSSKANRAYIVAAANYADRLGIDLGRAVAYKFNRVSERRGAPQLLYPDHGTACPIGNLSADRLEDGESASNPKGTT